MMEDDMICVDGASVNVPVRWLFDFESWKPSEQQWKRCLSLLPQIEQDRILRFERPSKDGPIVGRFNSNAKSAMIGRLMLRKCVSDSISLQPSNQIWSRTLENKPFLSNMDSKWSAFLDPNGGHHSGFNFNVSHAGDLVVLASDFDFIIGVDVMKNELPYEEPIDEFFACFDQNFTSNEWKLIKKPITDKGQITAFMRQWTLKESYIKSLGIGLGFDLLRAEFLIDDENDPKEAIVKIDGISKPNWHFELHSYNDHPISVSYGPIEECIDSVKESAKFPGKMKIWNPVVYPPKRIEFKVLTIEELIE